MKPLRSVIIMLAAMAPAIACAEECVSKPTADLTARISVDVPNDIVTGTLVTHASDATLEAISKQAKATINNALAIAKKYPSVTVRTGQTYTSPVQDQHNRKIKAWSIRSELILDSKDKESFAELVGTLQDKMEVASIQQSVSADKLRATEEATIEGAIRAFEHKAGLIASALGKKYAIRHIAVNPDQLARPVPMRAFAARSATDGLMSSPIPLEMGTSTVSVTVAGQITLE